MIDDLVGEAIDDTHGRTLDPLEGPEVGCKFPSFEVDKGVGPSLVTMPCLVTPCFEA